MVVENSGKYSSVSDDLDGSVELLDYFSWSYGRIPSCEEQAYCLGEVRITHLEQLGLLLPLQTSQSSGSVNHHRYAYVVEYHGEHYLAHGCRLLPGVAE